MVGWLIPDHLLLNYEMQTSFHVMCWFLCRTLRGRICANIESLSQAKQGIQTMMTLIGTHRKRDAAQ